MIAAPLVSPTRLRTRRVILVGAIALVLAAVFIAYAANDFTFDMARLLSFCT